MRRYKLTTIKWSLLALSLLHVSPASAFTSIRQPTKFSGGRVTVQTAAGGSCSSTAPDRATIGVIAGTTTEDYETLNSTSTSFGGYRDNNELVAGVGLVIPIGGTVSANCNKLVEMEEARTKMELAVTLYESGSLTKEELNQILNETKSILLK